MIFSTSIPAEGVRRAPRFDLLTVAALVGAALCTLLDAYLAHDTFYHALGSQGPAVAIAAAVAFTTLFGPMYAARMWRQGRRGVAAVLLAGVVVVIAFVASVRAIYGVGESQSASGTLGALAGSADQAEKDDTTNLLIAVGMAAMMTFTAGLAFTVELRSQGEKVDREREALRAELRVIESELSARRDPANEGAFSPDAAAGALERELEAKQAQVDAIYDGARLMTTTMLVGRMDQASADEVTRRALGLPFEGAVPPDAEGPGPEPQAQADEEDPDPWAAAAQARAGAQA